MEKSSEDQPWIKVIIPNIESPSLNDNTADTDRLIKGIRKSLNTDKVKVDFSLIKGLTRKLREADYSVRAIVSEEGDSWRLIDIYPCKTGKGVYGLAVDLGSSTIVVRLLDLLSRETVIEKSFQNPQIEIGSDILTRIHFAAKKGGLEKLQDLLIKRLNREILALAGQTGIEPVSIVGVSAAGNTTMTHLFLGLDPYWICREPYIPTINNPDIITAFELGLEINQEAPVLVFPNVGSYFGGDLIAGILASGMSDHSDISFLIDVGTNAEVVIGNSEWLMACAGAAGPALEGGVANMGMMAGPGVIDKILIDPDTLKFSIRTIDSQPPIGICGSGMIDLVAQLFLAGMIDVRGKYNAERCGGRITEIDGIRHLVLVPEAESASHQALSLSQTDIDGLIRSKAAMYTILTTISNTVNIPLSGIGRFYVAGTFGSYIDPQSAITIGMIPDLPRETYVSLGNTSIKGASRALLFLQDRNKIRSIRDRVTYLELNVNQEFMHLFSAAKFLPHTDRTLFPSVRAQMN